MADEQTLLPDDDPQIALLERDLERARADSYMLDLAVRKLAAPPPADPAPLLDALVGELEYSGLGANWIEVPRRIAAKVLAQLIGYELAYPEEVVPPEQAEALAGRFLGLFPAGARYFTNGACSGEFAVYDIRGEEVLGWRSLSEAPFDNGIVGVSAERVGMLWAEDAP